MSDKLRLYVGAVLSEMPSSTTSHREMDHSSVAIISHSEDEVRGHVVAEVFRRSPGAKVVSVALTMVSDTLVTQAHAQLETGDD